MRTISRELAGSLAMLLTETIVLAGPDDGAQTLHLSPWRPCRGCPNLGRTAGAHPAAQGKDGPIAAWRINTVARALKASGGIVR
jgi:hypothetical protein